MREKAVALALALSAFLATTLAYRARQAIEIDFERGYEGAFVEGFHPRERAEGKYFRWTDDASYVVLRNLPPGTFQIEARLKTIRPGGEPLPSLAFTANGVTVHRARAFPGAVAYSFEVPSKSSVLRLGIESETFEAAGGRKLGVQVLGVRLASEEVAFGGFAPGLWAALAALLLLATGFLAGLPLLASAGAAVILSLAFQVLLRLDAARFTTYPRDLAILAAGAAVAAWLLRMALGRAGWLHPAERARAVGILALLLLIKMAFLSYPLMLSSDADFQANRMSEMLQGNWHPTSVTQHEEPFRIPYPVSLYVLTAPLAMLGVDLVPALEIVTGLSDVLVSGLLMFLAWRFLDDFRAGAIAAVLYPLVPMNVLSFSAGNFTNLFAVAMLTLAVASFLSSRAVVTGVSNLLALTAHFGMLLEAVVFWPLTLALAFLAPPPARDRRRTLFAAIAASFILAGLYYLGYLDLFRGQWERAVSSGAGADSVGSGLHGRLGLLGEQLGWVFLATALLGSLSFVRRPLAGGVTSAASAWLLATLFFLALDLASPIEIRYWLQALPLLAFFAGAYLSRAIDRGKLGKAAAVGVIAYVAVTGIATLYESMVLRYH